MSVLEEETLHFTVTGEFMTEHCRNLWAEGSFRHCMKTLNTMIGMSLEQKFDLIRGKLKLIGDSTNGMGPEEDNWTVEPDSCHMCRYPDPEDMFEFAESDAKLTDEIKHKKNGFIEEFYSKGLEYGVLFHGMDEWEELRHNTKAILGSDFDQEVEKMCDAAFHRGCDHREEQMAAKYSKEDEDALEDWTATTKKELDEREAIEKKYNLPRPAEGESLDERRNQEFLQREQARQEMEALIGIDLDEAGRRMAGQTDIDTTPHRKPNKPSGYITPDGKYYGCHNFEHGALIIALDTTEIAVETSGWIKISYNQGNGEVFIHHEGIRRVTKKQQNLLWDWAVKYKKEDNYKQFMDRNE